MKETLPRACIIAAGLLAVGGRSLGADVPKMVRKLGVDGKELKPFVVSLEELRSFLQVVEGEDFRAILETGHKLFRPHAKLADGYEELLTPYAKPVYASTVRYAFAGGGGKVTADVNARTAMVVWFHWREGEVRRPRLDPPDDSTALRLARNYLDSKDMDLNDCGVGLSQFGQKTRFITVASDMSPPCAAVYVMNPAGEIHEKSLESLAFAHDREFSDRIKKRSPMTVIESFVRLHSYDLAGGKIISGTHEIPGYKKHPLDEDLHQTIRAPFHFKDRSGPAGSSRPGKGSRVHVVYTYERTGGVVRRYRFVFEKGYDFRIATCIILGRDVGAAEYLE